jgi:FAD/FMN-containing dehydrogenase
MATSVAVQVEELTSRLRGDVIGPDDPRYDDARKLYNAMFDKRPRLIARCLDAADVIAAVNFARDEGLEVAVRSGGHNGAGLGSVDDGLVIDLSLQKWVRVDPDTQTVQVGPGCTLGDLDHATSAFGLAVPVGIFSTTGVAGLSLGGGVGHLTRKWGLSVDNFLAVDLVLADGSFVQANADENSDLFWAIRGGGGNFGVVTAFTFQAHPVSTVIAGPTLWPLERTTEVLEFYRDFIHDAPDDLNGFFAFLTVPPGPPFPEELHMQKMCGIVWCWTGAPEDADEALRPVRDMKPALDGIGPVPFAGLQGAFDPIYPPGQQQYWRADFVDELSDGAIARHAEFAPTMPTWQTTMHLYPLSGAAANASSTDTAWNYRSAKWAAVILAVSDDPADAGLLRDWTADYWEAIHPYAAQGSGGYVNFMMDEGLDRVRASYGTNYDRLAAIKAMYDPTNFFHVNQNIQPA